MVQEGDDLGAVADGVGGEGGLAGAGRSLDHAELVIEGILHRLKLAGIATEGEDQTLGRVCLSLIHLWMRNHP